MGALAHMGGDLGQVQVHRLDVAFGEDEAGGLAQPGADGAEYVGGGGALVLQRYRAGAPSAPASCDLCFLSDPRFVGEPDLYAPGRDGTVARDLRPDVGEAVLKSAIASSACPWWRGRADNLRKFIARNSRLMVGLAMLIPNVSHTHWHRSISHHRTTP